VIDLKKISDGKQEKPPRTLLYGADGIGKTKFAAGAPDPFFIDLNRGSFAYDVKRVIPESWTETLEWIGAVERGSVKCGSLVIDSVSDLEHLGNTEFFPGSTIDKWDGGYGRGETYAVSRWRELVFALERVWNTGKPIILLGHMVVKSFSDPLGANYDRHQVSGREKIVGLLRQSMDYVFFASLDIAHQKVSGEIKAVTSGTRWMYTQRSPAFDAKSRGTTLFPEKILLSWDEFAKARAADKERAETLRQEIGAMLAEIGDKKLDEQVSAYLKSYPEGIVEARNRVAARLEEIRKTKEAVAT
jgi:AAA domain-containing protein